MTTNVRFYRLGVLPSFEVDKHKGIFVHVTGIMDKNGGNPKNPNALLMNIKSDTLVQWLTERRIDKIASGLWFGGENGWELLSNETNSGAIDAAINAKIAALDIEGYAQAEITTANNSSTLTIKGIQEVDGKIGIPADSENLDLDIAIDGVYTESNKIATQSTVTTAVTNAIEALDVNTIQAVTIAPVQGNTDNTVLTFKGIKEVDGKIAQGDDANPSTLVVGDAKLKIQIGSDEAGAFEVFSANAKENKSIYLDENVFKKNVVEGKNVLSVIAKSTVTSGNKLVTEQDIARLSSAMYYKGSIASNDGWPANTVVKAGDVWIASGNFQHVNESIESGDLIVFNTDGDNSKYTVIQSNITLGIGDGQVAANVGALADGMLVVGVNSGTGKGIKTVEFDVTNLTEETGKNERKLALNSQRPDRELQSDGVESVEGLYHSVGITDTFTIMGRNMSKSFSISSPNRSISIEKVGDVNSTDAQIDLIWNTVMDA